MYLSHLLTEPSSFNSLKENKERVGLQVVARDNNNTRLEN